MGLGEMVKAESSADAARVRFAQFFMGEWPRLHRHIGRGVGADTAEDIAQEAFLRVYAASRRIETPGAYLYRTAHSLLGRERRRRRRNAAAPLEMAETVRDPAPLADEATHWRLRLERVVEMVATLPAKRRRVFLLRVIEDMTYAEIAELLGMSVNAVEKHLVRAFAACAAWRRTQSEGAGDLFE